MSKSQSSGVTLTERFLADLCGRCFLGLWSYANPYKDDGHEFCDVLAVFENIVFIFFDRERPLADFVDGEDPVIRWERWKRKVIDKQIDSANGAERYLRNGREVYLDPKNRIQFPIEFDRRSMIIHKIIVAHGAAEACRNFSDSNVHGSLAMSYGSAENPWSWPFMVHIDKNEPISIFDTHNLPIVLGELDTIKDFSNYLDAKNRAISQLDCLSYCGEEDLLAHYLLNFDKTTQRHYIGTTDLTVNGLFIGEGEWRDFSALPQYLETKKANSDSYLWDSIILKTSRNWNAGTLLGNDPILSGRGAIHEMAKEPRFMRREYVKRMRQAIDAFPDSKECLLRHLTFFGSQGQNKAYVFLQVWVPLHMRGAEDSYRAKRQEMLIIACGAAKNRYANLKLIIGIGVPPPKLESGFGEDFVLLDCHDWSDNKKLEYEHLNENWNFFKSGEYHETQILEFLPSKES